MRFDLAENIAKRFGPHNRYKCFPIVSICPHQCVFVKSAYVLCIFTSNESGIRYTFSYASTFGTVFNSDFDHFKRITPLPHTPLRHSCRVTIQYDSFASLGDHIVLLLNGKLVTPDYSTQLKRLTYQEKEIPRSEATLAQNPNQPAVF